MNKKCIIFVCLLVSAILLQGLSGQALHIDDDGIVWIEVDGKQIKLQEYLIPVGTVNSFIGSAAYVPDGWLICDGRRINKTDNNEYEDLVDLLRNVANGDEQHPFIYACNNDEANLPDLRGRFIRGVDNPGTEQGAAGRDDDHGIRTNEPGAVQEEARENIADENIIGGVVGSLQGDAIRNITGSATSNRGLRVNTVTGAFERLANYGRYGNNNGADAFGFDFNASRVVPTGKDNRPKNVYLNFIIKY